MLWLKAAIEKLSERLKEFEERCSFLISAKRLINSHLLVLITDISRIRLTYSFTRPRICVTGHSWYLSGKTCISAIICIYEHMH